MCLYACFGHFLALLFSSRKHRKFETLLIEIHLHCLSQKCWSCLLSWIKRTKKKKPAKSGHLFSKLQVIPVEQNDKILFAVVIPHPEGILFPVCSVIMSRTLFAFLFRCQILDTCVDVKKVGMSPFSYAEFPSYIFVIKYFECCIALGIYLCRFCQRSRNCLLWLKAWTFSSNTRWP